MPAAGQTFAPGTFTVSLTLTNLGGTGTPCTQTGTISQAATVNAGGDQTICEGSTVTLAGSVGGGASTGTWSGGTGTFNPNANTLNAVYTPSAAEIQAGTVTLTLTTNDPTGPCGTASDNMTITITANPTRPTVTYQGPACNEITFSVTVVDAVAGGSYTLTQDAGGVQPITKTTAADANSNIVFSGLTVGKGFSIVLTVGDCTSDATDCSNYKTPTNPLVTPRNVQTTETVNAKIESQQSKVIAAPNPFSNKIKFNLESAVSGQGS